MFNQRAFTLIEMLIIVIIIGILSVFVFIQMNNAIDAGKDVQRKADIELLANAVVSYASDHYNSKPVTDTDGCEIGIDCGTEIENSLKVYLPTLPDDPNAGTAYVYQSDGNDCTIFATLSDNTVYQYFCSSDSIVIGTPTNGVCGAANNKTYAYNITTYGTDTICTSGTANPTSPAFPAVGGSISWTCTGMNTGTTASCSASRLAAPINGTCGFSNGLSLASAPTTGLCSSGAPSVYGSWSWTCLGLNGGSNSGICSAIYLDLYKNLHSTAQCYAAGGILDDWDENNNCPSLYRLCLFEFKYADRFTATCPPLWTFYGSSADAFFDRFRVWAY